MAIELIDTLAPKNNGAFPMVNAKDVDVDGKRLPEKLKELETAAGNIEAATDDDINNLFNPSSK
ncbi:hypothetical protein BLI708_08645 [Bifidobacterium imperatoris]|uniref:Uncharacterized protein n=1 Tax=Bifidobacterium imperatoris TaxID=2020965 RepID=A0A2N5IQI3_9BIFI|nr:hypothetical protein [Bifidobacterium imperatoris]PLS24206.1 hypothetical protein Tam1G_1783 [Bifidobacterium imperatoris]QSY57296.1 hypothetical protein BLI708_08645 [Bifidobacterium imperatoris]